ncbi:ATP-binding cassette sub-family A member 2 isoform X2 [Malaya genurostris]|uniref:ATP-binding cassette sub-family A member 2 isoform X2 n=1 Tax=Malaya genurostris TaxID=325434 RepID=UPI0026F3A0BA|nr:ATP-binding cassette sub-family A member 2 isoform X2 [Malaya genurostris]
MLAAKKKSIPKSVTIDDVLPCPKKLSGETVSEKKTSIQMTQGTSLIEIFLIKAWKEKRRHPVRNVLNTLFPIVVVTLYVFSRSGYQRGGARKSAPETPVLLADAISQDELIEFYPTGTYNKLYYSPKNEFTEELIEHVRQKLSIIIDRVEGFSTTDEMEHVVLASQDFYAITFGSNSSEARLSYTIRSKNNNFRTQEVYSRDPYTSFLKDRNEYFESGFLALQYAIEKSFLEIRTGLADESLPEYRYEHIPLGGERPQESSEIFVVNMILAVFISVACTYLLLVPLVEEKASGMKEYLKIATPNSYWNEVAIFAVSFIQLFVISVVCMIITNVALVWALTTAQVVCSYLLLFLFVICTIMFTFFISTLLESVTISTIVAPICYFAPVIFASAQKRFESCLLIFPMAGFKVGVSILHDYQNSWRSFTAGDAFATGYPGNARNSLVWVMVMLIFGTIVWALLWFYISNVFPGKYGTPKKFLFLFERSYYQKSSNKINNSHDRSSLTEEDNNDNEKVMENGDHLEKVVKITKLNKTFKTSFGTRTAVKDLSLKIYKNRITALLGHNGAGKTTTMNIITGMTPRTSGSIEIDGEENSNNYRQQIGFCPQHNVALKYMTCREHLTFFGAIRGINIEQAKLEADEILGKVNLLEKSDEVLSNLSGGMKRRLCLANAIIGRTKLLILDEPTSGLDPESRRDIWDILLRLKKDHTILITTHFMEEADVLGDWIAIMENGELIAFGTSMFLKHYYGKGYTLKLLKKGHFKKEEVLAKIRDHISVDEEKPSVEPVFAVTLPYITIEQYAPLLKDLEENKETYGFDRISITNATLEEVFLNSSAKNKALEQNESFDVPDGPSRLRSPASSNGQVKQTVKFDEKICWPLLQQFFAISYKKYIHIRANLHIYGLMSCLPIVTAIFCFMFSNSLALIDYDSVALHHSAVDRAFVVIMLNNNDRPIDVETLRNSTSFKNLDIILADDGRIEDYLVQEAGRDWNRYLDQLIAAIEFNVSDRSLTILHNNNLLHSAPIAANIGNNLLLNYYGYPKAEISVRNSPINRRSQLDSMTPYLFTESIALAFMLYILQFLQLPYLEASSGFKQLQNINRYVYWGSSFLLDFLLHIIICLFVYCVARNMDREVVFSRTEHIQILGILIMYGLAALLVIYIISQCVDSMDTAVTFMSYLLIIGVCGVLLLSDGYDRIRENGGIIMLLHLIPEFALKHSLRVVYENQKLNRIEALIRANTIDHSRSADRQLDLNGIYVLIPTMMLVLIVVLNEVVENMYRKGAILEAKTRTVHLIKYYLRCGRKRCKDFDQTDSNYEMCSTVDDDVDAETNMVNEMVAKEPQQFAPYTIAVHNLKKRYLKLPAVKGVSFAVKRGECFGLLGMNGAGKTSTFQMITRNLPITDGTVYLNESDVRKSYESVYRSQFGYCPQGDALLDFMTPYQLLNYSARVKNLKDRENLVNRWLTDLDILSFAHNRINECSGGTKRKVNTALAMLGNPSIVFLDEPTTGVDPKSRHFVWGRIKSLQRQDQTIILTSHSMDECEELCNRLSIMVGGQLRCIGFIQRLKEKYGKGYNLWLKLNSNSSLSPSTLVADIQRRFRCEIKEEHDGMLKFLVPEPIRLSELFAQITSLKRDYDAVISSFSINETSLEDIFLNFKPPSVSARCGRLVEDIV